MTPTPSPHPPTFIPQESPYSATNPSNASRTPSISQSTPHESPLRYYPLRALPDPAAPPSSRTPPPSSARDLPPRPTPLPAPPARAPVPREGSPSYLALRAPPRPFVHPRPFGRRGGGPRAGVGGRPAPEAAELGSAPEARRR